MGEDRVRELRRLAGTALVATADDEIDGALAVMARVMAADAVAPAGSRADADAPAGAPVEVVDVASVGVPAHVRLVAPRDLKRRTWGSPEGRFVTLHALAHIEANAVNLALDAVHRFGAMPEDYYLDWTRVAIEERRHFLMLCERLAAHGGAYGDLSCHNGLWEIAEKTAYDPGARMGLVPLVFEARGLDVTPGLIERFQRHGDHESAGVLEVVLRDEIGHVAVGHRWFEYVCEQRGVDPVSEFERLVAAFDLLIVPPFNDEARVQAGFRPDDLARWESSFVGSRHRPIVDSGSTSGTSGASR